MEWVHEPTDDKPGIDVHLEIHRNKCMPTIYSGTRCVLASPKKNATDG